MDNTAPANPADAAGFTAALREHLRWQRAELARGDVEREPPRFLVLRPGDKLTVCRPHGDADLRKQCFRATPPSTAGPAGVHWDATMLRDQPAGTSRPVPGLGNVALSLVAAAAVAIASRRVLLLENFTRPGASFGAPVRELLAESSGWAPALASASRLGAADGFASHDDFSAFAVLCSADLRVTPAARVWRVWSNQYFAPLLLLNPHHAAQVEAMAEALEGSASGDGEDGGGGGGGGGGRRSLWTPGLRALWRPSERLRAQLELFRAAKLRERYVGIHVRVSLQEQEKKLDRLGGAVSCLRARLAANNASTVFLATMHSANRRALAQALRPFGHRVVWYGRAVEVQAASRSATDSALADMALMGGAAEVLISAGSTFGYVAQGLSGRRATLYGGTHTSRELVGPRAPDCSAVGTTEAAFHFLPHATRRYTSCREGAVRAKQSALFLSSAVRH